VNAVEASPGQQRAHPRSRGSAPIA
jgi:hypothetical protein